jgi:hypothetical protein
MRYWVFNQEQLDPAVQEYSARIAEPGVEPGVVASIIREFLESPEARKHKLQGGASYSPEEDNEA